jgi:hypothetical protein
MLSSGRRARHRRFDYQPRFYDPKREEGIKRRMRIQSRAQRRRSPAGIIYFAILLIIALIIYNML